MVAAKDVGARAAELLTEEPFRQPSVREILGARDYTMAEATAVLGSAIGKPGLKHVQIPYDDARKHMLGVGLSPSFIHPADSPRPAQPSTDLRVAAPSHQ